MNRNKQTEVLGVIITAIILILLIFLTNIELGKFSYFESLASSVVNPVQKVFNDIKNKVQGNTSYFDDYETIKRENEELKIRNSELEENVRELEVLKADNKTLQEYMNLTQKYADYSTLPANVITRDVSNFSSNLIIDVGSDDGVKEKMTVIADKGLVGYVLSVTPHTSKIQLIIDSASTVSCNLTTSNESIICKGTLDNDQTLRATYIPTSAELIQGDTVTTSGLGGIYHRGIYIGSIKEIVTTSNLTDRYAVVEPAVDFSKLETVLVVLNEN